MKVIYVSPNGYLGGAERFVLNAVIGHQRSGKIDASILFFQDGEAVKLARQLGLPYQVLQTKFKLTRPLALLKAGWEIRKILQQERIDLVHSTMAYAHLVTSLATLFFPIRRAWFQHGPVGGALDKVATLFRVELLFFNGRYLQNLHHASFPHSRITQEEVIVPLAVNHGEPRTIFRDIKIQLGTAGRICEFKALDRIIANLHKTGLPFELRIAGSAKTPKDEEYFQSILHQCRNLPPEQKVIFLGHVESMREFYRSIDVFIHDALYPEPFGLVLVEAMAQGALVVTRKAGGLGPHLAANRLALSYETDQELIHLMRKILQQEGLDEIQQIAIRGQREAVSNFSEENMIRTLEKSYLRTS